MQSLACWQRPARHSCWSHSASWPASRCLQLGGADRGGLGPAALAGLSYVNMPLQFRTQHAVKGLSKLCQLCCNSRPLLRRQRQRRLGRTKQIARSSRNDWQLGLRAAPGGHGGSSLIQALPAQPEEVGSHHGGRPAPAAIAVDVACPPPRRSLQLPREGSHSSRQIAPQLSLVCEGGGGVQLSAGTGWLLGQPRLWRAVAACGRLLHVGGCSSGWRAQGQHTTLSATSATACA